VRIALVRHPAPLIGPGICYGRLDVKLHPSAAVPLAALAARLAGFADVVTSPARRCRLTAAAIAGHATIDPRLLELDFGAWEGQPWDTVPRRDLDRWAADPLGFAPPGGETGAALVGRVRGFHDDLLARARDCVVVSHGGPLRVLAALLHGRPVNLLAPAPPLGSVEIIG
jgi:alpha-ribazole phosphatase